MKKIIYLILGILLLSPTLVFAEEEIEIESTTKEKVTLEECVDINIAKIRTSNNDIIKVRFLALDVDSYKDDNYKDLYNEAKDFVCSILTNSDNISIEYDSNYLDEDVYGRKLVWLYVNDILIQTTLIEKGYAKVDNLYDKGKYIDTLEDSENSIKSTKIGLWNNINDNNQVTEENNNSNDSNFISKFFNNLLASIFDFIDNILDSILSFIESML